MNPKSVSRALGAVSSVLLTVLGVAAVGFATVLLVSGDWRAWFGVAAGLIMIATAVLERWETRHYANQPIVVRYSGYMSAVLLALAAIFGFVVALPLAWAILALATVMFALRTVTVVASKRILAARSQPPTA